MEQIRYFVPGPAFVRQEVRDAMTREIIPHRSPEFIELYRSLEARLQPIFRTTGEVLVATSSSTFVMEAALVSTVSSRVLNLTCGAFSERWHEIAKLLGKKADRISAPWGEAVDPDLVRRALRRTRYEAVTIVHNETSTGVMNPLEELACAVRDESDALILVDAVSSLGGAPIETDDWGLDVVLAGTQKAMAAPPGLTVFFLSGRAARRAERIERRGFYTDLLRYRNKHRAGGTITTPAIPIVYALDRQLDYIGAEGVEQRWARHRHLAERVQERVVVAGGIIGAEKAARSWTLTCFEPPAGIRAPDLVTAMRTRGWVIAGGYGQWKESTVRIGHMGDVGARDLEALLEVLEESMIELGGGGPQEDT